MDIIPVSQSGLFSAEILPHLNTKFLRRLTPVKNLVCYPKEGPTLADIFTCSMPKVTEFMIERRIAKSKPMQDTLHQTVLISDTPDMSPMNFWVTDIENQDLAVVLRTELARLRKTMRLKLIMSPENGRLCLVVEKNGLLRAQVMQAEEHHIIVSLIDSGETKRYPKDSVFEMPDAIGRIKALATRCALYGIILQPQNKRTSRKVFRTLIADEELSLYVVVTGYPNRVDIINNSVSLAKHLVELGLFDKRDTSQDSRMDLSHPLTNLTQDLTMGTTFEVFITSVRDDGDFYVVKRSNEELLIKIAYQMQELSSKPSGNDFKTDSDSPSPSRDNRG